MSTAAKLDVLPTPQRILDIDPPEKTLPLPAMLKLVAEKHGKSLPNMVAEIARLSFGPGKVSTEEYFDLRLYDDALSPQEKKTFLGMCITGRIPALRCRMPITPPGSGAFTIT